MKQLKPVFYLKYETQLQKISWIAAKNSQKSKFRAVQNPNSSLAKKRKINMLDNFSWTPETIPNYGWLDVHSS